MKATITPLNYTDSVRILSGLDLRTKSNGQMPQQTVDVGFEGQTLWQEEIVGPKYGFHTATAVAHEFSLGTAAWENIHEDGLVMQGISFEARQGQTYTPAEKEQMAEKKNGIYRKLLEKMTPPT